MSRRSPIIQDESNADPELEPLAPSDPTCPDKPAPFDFLTENIYYAEVLTSRERKKAKRMVCECQFDPEQDAPEDACGESCLNRLLMIECGSRCPCGEYCTNKRFQRGDYSKVEVFRTKKKGWGLRTLASVAQGAFVMEYCGEVISPVQFEERKKQYTNEKRRHYYFMSLRSDEILDATQKGNLSRFINHSCDPNCETQKWTVQGKLRIGFFTVRKVTKGEEITFDYQFQRFGDVAQRCYCGSSNCRGYLGQSKQATPLRTATIRSLRDIGSPREGGWRRRSAVRAESQEDSFFEKQIYDIVGSSWRLRNTDQVISISRIMLQAESLGQRIMLLYVLQATEDQSCLRKFLSLHGLRLLWSWMVDSPEPDSVNVLQFREQLLQVLDHLPITTRNQITDSHLVTMVKRWLEPATKPQDLVASITCPPQPPELPAQTSQEHPLLQSSQQQQIGESSSMEATVVTEADSNMDSDVIKIEEEEGSCDSGGVVGAQSCDAMVDSKKKSLDIVQDSCRDVQEMEADSDLKHEGGGLSNVAINEAESVNKVERSCEVDSGVYRPGHAADDPITSGSAANKLHDQESVSCDVNKPDVMQHSEVASMSCDSVTQSCAPMSDADSVEPEHLYSVQGSVTEEESHDKELVSRDKDMELHDRTVESHDQEITSHDKEVQSYDHEMTSHDRTVESHDHEMASHDRTVESCDHEMVSHDREMESHDQEMASPDRTVESQDQPSHDKEVKSFDQEMASHDKKVESHDQEIAPYDKEVESHDQEMTSHDREVQSYDKEMASHDRTVEPCDQEMASHDKTVESCDQEMASHNREVESHDQEMASQVEPCDKEMASHDRTVESCDQEIASHDREVESHKQEMASHDKEVKSHDQEMAIRERKVESHDQQMASQVEPCDQEMASHDRIVESCDQEIASHDKEVESHDQEMASHDRTVESCDQEIASHDKEVESHDQEMAINDKEVESHDQEMASHDRTVESCDQEIASHDKEVESHDQEMAIHDKEVESHDQEMASHDEVESHDQEIASHDKEVESYDQEMDKEVESHVASHEVESHNQEMGSQDKEVESHDQEIWSHDKEVEPHDQEMGSHDKKVELRDQEMRSQEKEVESHDQEMGSHDKEVESHDQEMGSHDKEVELHDQEMRSYDKEVESHDQEIRTYDKEVESHDQEMRSYDKEVESHDQEMRSYDKEVESHDQEMRSYDKEVESYNQEVVDQASHEKIQVESHYKEQESLGKPLESADKYMVLQDKAMESRKMNVVSHDESGDKNVVSHDKGLESGDNNVVSLEESGDKSVVSHDKGLESGDKNVVSHDESGDKSVVSHDKGLESGDKNVVSHDKSGDKSVVSHEKGLESGDKNLVSHDKGLESGDKSVVSHDKGLESGDKNLVSHDKGLESGDKSVVSHDKGLESSDNDLVSHDTDVKLEKPSNSTVKMSQKAEIRPFDDLVMSHDLMISQNVEMTPLSPDSEAQSHMQNAAMQSSKNEWELNSETGRCEPQVCSSGAVMVDRPVEVADQTKSPAQSDNKNVSPSNDPTLCDGSLEKTDTSATNSDVQVTSTELEPCSLVHEQESRANAVSSRDSKPKSRDDRGVKSHGSDSSSDTGDDNEVMSCEAEAKQVNGAEGEALVAASARVVTMATELLEKWEGLKEVFRIPKRAQSTNKPTSKLRVNSPRSVGGSNGGREEDRNGSDGGRVRERRSRERGGERRSRERGERKRRWDHWTRSPPPPDPPVAWQSQDATPTWPSSKRRVLLPNPKNIFTSSTSSVSPSPHHTPAQPAQLPPSTSTTPSQPPYVVTQNTGTTFTSSTRFPTPPVPVQNTVIVQQGGQSVYVQQQVYQDGCQTTIMPTHYMPPTQPFMIPAPTLQPPQNSSHHQSHFQSTATSHTTQAPPTITQVPPTLTQPLPTHPHSLTVLPTIPPQIPATGFIPSVFSQSIPQMMTAPPSTQSSATPSSLPPPPPTEAGLPYNWRTAKDPAGKTYYYHVITRKSQWTRPTDRDAEGIVTMDLASSDEVKEESVQTESLKAPHTPDGTPPPFTMTSEKNYDTESTDATPSPCPSPHFYPPNRTSPPPIHTRSPHSPQRSPPPSPHTPPLLPPPSTPPPSTTDHHLPPPVVKSTSPSPNVSLPGPSTPLLSPSHSSPLSPSPCTHATPEPLPPPEKRAKVTKSKHHKQRESFKHKVSKVVTQCLDQHRKADCKYGRITCSEDFKYLARKLTHGLAEKELHRRHGSTDNLVFNDSVKSKVKEYIRQYMKKYGPIYSRT